MRINLEEHNVSTQVSFSSESHRLTGTLESGSDGSPLALLVSGSGPIDRDSNMKRMRLNVMADIARHLADRGIGSLRYDKRGVGASSGNYHATGLLDNVADARSALQFLRGKAGSREVFLVGHSEGALIAGEVAAGDTTLGGVVLLAGTASNGEVVLRRQAELMRHMLPGPIRGLLKLLRKDVVAMQQKRLERLRASTEDVIRMQFVKVNARWFREFLAYEPAEALGRVTVPVLAVTGAKDVQVDPEDIDTLGGIVGGAYTGEVPAELTHILRRTEGPPSVRDYKKLVREPVDAGLLDLVAGWITGTAGEGRVDRDDV